jgi:hypothetical protein
VLRKIMSIIQGERVSRALLSRQINSNIKLLALIKEILHSRQFNKNNPKNRLFNKITQKITLKFFSPKIIATSADFKMK